MLWIVQEDLHAKNKNDDVDQAFKKWIDFLPNNLKNCADKIKKKILN